LSIFRSRERTTMLYQNFVPLVLLNFYVHMHQVKIGWNQLLVVFGRLRVTGDNRDDDSIDAEGGCVRGHVQTVGQQGHRTKEDAGRDFDNHHDTGNGDDNDSTNLTRAFLVLTEPMAVLPQRMFIVLHHLFDAKQLMKVNCFLSESADKGE
jgi:hypothetical protein